MLKKSLFIIIGVLFLTINSSAQEKKPWWKKLFKKETVSEKQKPIENTPVLTPVKNTPESPNNVPEITPTAHTIQLLEKTGDGDISFHNTLPLDSINNNLKHEEQNGYRIQIYFGGLSTAKGTRASYMGRRTGDLVYLELKAPNYVVVVGNYRNKIEAYQNLHRIQRHYPKAFIVDSKIE